MQVGRILPYEFLLLTERLHINFIRQVPDLE